MDKYKNLNTTVRTSLFKQESMVDKIQFLIPPEYEGIDISDYIVTLKYVDPNGNFHSEVLEKDIEMYKDYLRYALPVTTKLTQVAGTIMIRLTLVKFANEAENVEIDKLETASTTLSIRQPDGFSDYVNFEDIEAYKAQVANLNRDVEKLSEEMPNDLAIGEHENLHLTHDGERIGEGVEILMPTMSDEQDDSKDGIFDVDEMNFDPEPEPSPIFIEV